MGKRRRQAEQVDLKAIEAELRRMEADGLVTRRAGADGQTIWSLTAKGRAGADEAKLRRAPPSGRPH